MPDTTMPLDTLLGHLHGLANEALPLWDLPDGATARLINVSENATYLVEAPGGHKSVLRVHREAYHTRRAIECELAWIDALGQAGVVTTSGYYLGRDGEPIQSARTKGLQAPRYLVLFRFLDGDTPSESGDLTPGFEELGAIAARCHVHALGWQRPKPFERLAWDVDSVFGANPTWGNWRDAPNVSPGIRTTLEAVERTIRSRLAAYGKAPERYNLIHADMRLANLLIDQNGTRLIDFDDCGFGWLMYDFAAAISFIEDDPRIPEFKAAWLRGYRSERSLAAEDEAEIDTLIMLRRLALLAWIGSHIEAPEPQALAPDFALTTARLGRAWLDRLC
ncbi:MAG: phosphotransferase [Silicimonas sp.]|jgi:Ser/Thr protein kinase RdoA (MazF antagonist)|nr:phosphotransferase [Silicimonas sp.]